MDEYLDKGIKEVIDEFPDVGKILDEYGIGCGPCAVGTCLLKDIVEIHGLPAGQEQEMMARSFSQFIFLGVTMGIPRTVTRLLREQKKGVMLGVKAF